MHIAPRAKRGLTLASLVLACTLAAACERLMDQQVEKNLSRADTGLLTSPDMTVMLCGTGSPLAAADRAAACTAVIAGGQMILVDVGPGSWKTVDLQNLPTSAVGTILLTHLHSDHIGDLGEAITQSWIAGRAAPLDVYGPVGTEGVVAGFQQAYAPDKGYRVKHHGEAALPPDGDRAVAHEIALPADPIGAVTIFEKNGLKVSAFRVDHQPVEPALGYRFDYKGRSVVVSGDTKKSAAVQHNAEGADILVHEALQPTLILRAARVAQETGRTRLAGLASDITTYHTTPIEAAEIARDAHVKHLVFTHLVPAPTNFLVRREFLAGVSGVYSGEVTLGADGMRFSLPPAS